MWIESITVHGFGCLAERRYEFPCGKVVLVIDENERGKSTLAGAIIAGLCGFPRRRGAREHIKLSEVYRPWTGESYSLRMEIEAGGMRLAIERDFAGDTFIIRDRETNRDISSQFEGDLASHFLRLPREDFMRVAVVAGKDVHRFSSSPNLRERLAAVVEGTGDESGAETAIASLAGAKYTLDGRPIKPETAVQRLSDAIDGKTRRMRALDAGLEAVDRQVRELDDLRAKNEELSQSAERLDIEYAASRLAQVRKDIAATERDSAERAALEHEMADLEAYAGFPAERTGQLRNSSGRMRVHERELEEKTARQGALNSESDQVGARVEPLSQFTLATNDDLIGLASASDALATARKSVEDATREQGTAKRGGASAGRMAMAIGVACGVVSIGLMVLGKIPVAWSLVGVLVGALIAALGGVAIAGAAGAKTSAQAALAQATESQKEARERATRRLSALGAQVTTGADLDALLDRTQSALTQYLDDRKRLRTIALELGSVTREIAECRARVDDENGVIRSILTDARIEPGTALEEALVRFDEAGRRHARYRQIRDTLLPVLDKRMPDDAALARLKSEETNLAARIDSADSPSAPRWYLEVEAERTAVAREMEAAAQRIKQLEREVGLTVEAYRREYPVLEEEVSLLRRELRKASRYGAAIGRASEVLREVAEGTRRRWAAALNEGASAILPHLNPDYDTLRFDDTLDFTVRRIPGYRIIERREIDSQLSTGAKDQVYLAVRLACCAELSDGAESIPIILDDPLISFDDDRFASSLRYIVESLPRRNQVILLTCHRDRHQQVAGEEWFRNGITVVQL